MQEQFETGKAPQVEISACEGQLVISGWKRAAVAVSGEEFAAGMAELDRVTLSSKGDLDVKVPAAAGLTLGEMAGNVTLKHLDGHATLILGRATVQLHDVASVKIMEAGDLISGENINGPLTVEKAQKGVQLRNVGELHLTQVEGPLSVQYARGFVSIGEVSGELNLHTISGDVTVKAGKGDANLSNLGGRNSLPAMGGDIRLSGGLAEGEHQLGATGTILVRWPADAPVSLTASAPQVVCLLRLQDRYETSDEAGGMLLTGHIEEGKPILRLTSEKQIGIKPIYGVGDAAFDPALFDIDFAAPVIESHPETDSTLVEPAVPAPAPGGDADAATLAAQIEAALRDAGVELPAADLHAIVSSSVAAAMARWRTETGGGRRRQGGITLPSAGVQRAARAREATETALQRAEERINQEREKMASSPDSKGPPEPTAPTPDAVPGDEASDREKEQLHILNLLKEGLISVDQANLLLRALGG